MKRLIVAGAIGCALSAAPALGQTNTTCSVIAGKYLNCNTMEPPPLIPMPAPPTYTRPAPDMSGFANLFAALAARAARKREEKKAAQEEAIDQAARPGVIERLRAGDCHGAIDYAVAHGTLALAGDVADYCQRVAPVAPAE